MYMDDIHVPSNLLLLLLIKKGIIVLILKVIKTTSQVDKNITVCMRVSRSDEINCWLLSLFSSHQIKSLGGI